MNSLCTLLTALAFILAVDFTIFPARAVDDLLITEIMAANDKTLADEDGDFPDWIEIYNAGTNDVDLNGWYLTDSAGTLTKWRFPATNITVNSYLVVFASGKDRRVAGRPLHSNFQLSSSGEYLALVKTDGVTVQSAYSPSYSNQVAGISYGIPVTSTTTVLLSNGAAGRFTVPVNGNLGSSWTLLGFNDTAWTSVNNGVGFESDAAPSGSPVQIADSVAEFSGSQGQNGWFYGYWDKKADGNGTYEASDFIAFPRGTGNVLSPTNYWDGLKWDFPAGNPPWTELTAGGGHPSAENSNPSLPIHWAIRRYVSENNGPLRITGTLAAQSANGTCGDGTIGHIFVDGVEVFQRSVSYLSVGYSIVVSANVGSQIDFVIDPGAASNDSCDSTAFTAVIRTSAGATVVADTIADWSISGTQGADKWTYGYFNGTTGGVYATTKFIPYPSGTGPHSTANFWNGEAWQWFDGEPPFDLIGQIETRPSIFGTGGVNANEHRVIRRWISEVSGPLQIDWHIAKKDVTGGGVTLTIFQNGTQRDTFVLGATDFIGTNRTISIPSVQVGDAIDFAISPGADIIGDLVFFNATIHGSGTLTGKFATDVGNVMTNINATAYLRLPFNFSDATAINGLTLRMRYDDGFVAYLNGTRVASANAPETLDWNSAATAAHPDADAGEFQEFVLDAFKDFLVNGSNVLAIQGLNQSATDSDFLITAELLASRPTLDVSSKRYFSVPTPGSLNGIGNATLGPLIDEISHQPAEPHDAEDLFVTAKVSPTLNPVAGVSLYYRVMYGAESSVTMLDDGLHGDGAAGDGIYGAVIPNAAYTSGQLVRYYLISRDSLNNLTRQPPIGDTNNSSLYFGTVVRDPSLTNGLPVLHWFTQSTINSTTFARSTLYWMGELYDNVKMNVHGQSSQGFRNHSFNVDFNPDHHFKPDANLSRVDDINLLSSYADKAHMRVMLSYGIHADAGPHSPSHYAVPARMQSNGVFHSIMHIVENGDENYLKRLGRDPNGALYKMYTDPSVPANAEKKTRRWEDKSDFSALVAGINSGTNRTYIYDNVDVSEAINFFAAMIVTANIDCCHKNFYLYRDSDGDREWEMMPWDVDLSFGRNWQSGETYWDDRVYPNNGLFVGQTFPLGPFFFNNPVTRATYLRRVRTLQDEMLQTNGTPAAQLNFERQIDSWVSIMTADGALDLAKWGTWGGGNGGDGGPSGGTRIDSPTNPFYRTLPQSADEMKTNYMVNRRKFVFDQKMGNATEFPDAQPTNAAVTVGTVEYNPSNGNQSEEYFQLINTNAYAVDISGWKISGAVEMTFQGGVVIPRAGSSNILYVVADKKAFRNRSVAPRGAMGLYVEGPYKGQLSARGETIVLSDKTGRIVTTNTYVGNPTRPQQALRITEIMYHPPNPPSGPYEAEDFEYIELKNIGGTALDLNGVHFGSGVEFSFTGSAVTNLGAGQYVLVVRNIAAFTARYGGGFNIAGQYIGILANEGEEISLYDAVGEEILDFEYDNAWYPVTDGPGASLVIANENASFNSWSLKEGWRPSYHDFGGPGQADPPPIVVAPVLINEVLTHTDLPLVDAVELLNTNTAPVNIGGWFLTDDFATPKKYRIPNGTVIQPGGYLVFDETQFNTNTVPFPFSFSSKGDEAYLFSGDGTNLTGYLHGYEFGAAENGVSFGRYVNSQGDVHFVAQSARTLGANNALPKVGPVVISEISYHPVDGAGGADNQIDEFIELANISASPVPLQNLGNTWRLRDAVDFDFPAGVTLAPAGHLIVVSFNPTNTVLLAAFRARWNVSASIPFFGPYEGKLDNSGESVRLYRPDTPELGEVPYILVDQVDYSHALPWPAAADGIGPTLQKLFENAYGNDPLNWVAVGPSPGNPYVAGGTPPSITSQPVNTSAILGNPAFFSVTATGSAPLFYQWRFKGTNLPGEIFPTFTRPAVQPNQGGPYTVIVYNSAGSIESSNGVLTVLIPASITLNPTNRLVRIRPDPAAIANTNVTFVAGASSTTPLRYQWRFGGNNLPGETNSSLTITNVQLSHGGDYQCAITDDVGTVFTTTAKLIPLITPVIVQAPLSQTVPQGGMVSVSVTIGDGNPPPFYYEWRRGSAPIGKFTTNFKTNIFTFTTTNILATTLHRLVITNLANTSPSAVSAAFDITTVADADRDGLPDAYETALGLDPNSGADAAGDLDGDGMTNLAEYLAGTDPTNANSYLRIDNSSVPGMTAVSIAAVSNRTYSVQYTDSLSPSGTSIWSKAADIAARSTNRVETLTVPNSGVQRFWRVTLPGQP